MEHHFSITLTAEAHQRLRPTHSPSFNVTAASVLDLWSLLSDSEIKRADVALIEPLNISPADKAINDAIRTLRTHNVRIQSLAYQMVMNAELWLSVALNNGLVEFSISDGPKDQRGIAWNYYAYSQAIAEFNECVEKGFYHRHGGLPPERPIEPAYLAHHVFDALEDVMDGIVESVTKACFDRFEIEVDYFDATGDRDGAVLVDYPGLPLTAVTTTDRMMHFCLAIIDRIPGRPKIDHLNLDLLSVKKSEAIFRIGREYYILRVKTEA